MSTKPPSGTRDFLPDEIRRREYVINIVRTVYERYGFEPLETPAFENIETLLGKYGEEGNKLIFKILRRGEHEASGEADLALRYDLTVPLARVVAQYQNELPKFFKRYQIQPVWRADRPARGRFREFYQCDIDSMGSTSPVVEVEQLSAVSEVLEALGFSDFEIRLNHRVALAALLQSAQIAPGQHAEVLVALDKLDKIGVEGVEKELAARGVDAGKAHALLDIFGKCAAGQRDIDALAVLADFVRASEGGLAAVNRLREIRTLASSTVAARHIRPDPSLARGLSYYTGAIMEIAVPDLAGSLGGGGRYDNLIGTFLGRDVPACGFSLGLERIIVVMTERAMFPPDVVRAAIDVMVTMWNEDTRADTLALAADLRSAGLRVDVYPEAEKLGKQFKYGASRRVPFIVVMGDDERAEGNVSIKDLASSEQQTMPRAEAGAWIKRHLNPER
ncbi:MAG: histidine--tRNA ligase [Vicinamibacterales bacterium]